MLRIVFALTGFVRWLRRAEPVECCGCWVGKLLRMVIHGHIPKSPARGTRSRTATTRTQTKTTRTNTVATMLYMTPPTSYIQSNQPCRVLNTLKGFESTGKLRLGGGSSAGRQLSLWFFPHDVLSTGLPSKILQVSRKTVFFWKTAVACTSFSLSLYVNCAE